MKEIRRIYGLLGIGVVIISFSGILIKLSTAPPLIIAFYRMFFSSIILTPFFFSRYRNSVGLFLDYRPAIVGLLLSFHFILWITAFEYTNVANAVIFIALQPLFTLILEMIFARDDLRKGIVSGVLFALVGSIIISIGDISYLFSKIWGDLLAIAAAFMAASYLFVGRSLREEVEYFPYIYVVYTYTALILGLFVFIFDIPLSGYGRYNFLYFLGLAVGPTLIGHSSFNYSVRFLPTTIVSLAILGEPIMTTIFAWFLLGEKITLVTFIGGLFIITGIYQATVNSSRYEKRRV